jgi:hypothetical protein
MAILNRGRNERQEIEHASPHGKDAGEMAPTTMDEKPSPGWPG